MPECGLRHTALLSTPAQPSGTHTLECMAQDFFSALVIDARVVVRYRLEAADRGGFGERFSDALGYVRVLDDLHVEVETRGGTVSIDRAAITHAKCVPPPPPRRRPR